MTLRRKEEEEIPSSFLFTSSPLSRGYFGVIFLAASASLPQLHARIMSRKRLLGSLPKAHLLLLLLLPLLPIPIFLLLRLPSSQEAHSKVCCCRGYLFFCREDEEVSSSFSLLVHLASFRKRVSFFCPGLSSSSSLRVDLS